MSTQVDEIMFLARALADTQVAHQIAVRDFSNDQGNVEFADITALAEKWTEAEKALRTAVEKATK